MKLLLIIIVILTTTIAYSQPGLYTEADIEFQDLFIEAQLAKVTGDHDLQVEKLQEVIKRDKNSDAAYYELALSYVQQGNHELAAKNIDKALGLAARNQWYLLAAADIHEQHGNLDKAMASFNKLIEVNPADPTSYHRLAVLQTAANKPAAAIATLSALQQRAGIEEETSRRLYDLYVLQGQEKEALTALRSLSDAYPKNTRFLGNLANYYNKIGQENEALKVYTRILELDPTDSQASFALVKKKVPAGESDSYLSTLLPIMENINLPLDNKIQELMPYLSTMKKDSPESATLNKIANRLAELYPEEAKVYSLQADVLYYSGDYKTSLDKYKKAISLDDRKFSLWSQYMNNLWELENYTDLGKVSEEAIDLYPNQVSSFLFHAMSLKNLNKSGAESLVDEAMYIAGNNKSLIDQVSLTKLWLSDKKIDVNQLKEIDLTSIQEPIMLEVAGDLFHKIGNQNKAQELWRSAIMLGSKEDRVNKKFRLK